MLKQTLILASVLLPYMAQAQEEATTAAGKTVILFPDNTWQWKENPPSDTTVTDSTVVAIVKRETPKIYSDSASGFRGFLKPQFKLPALPEQSEGLYVFRVKVNKEGFVKEVTTTQHGPNGEAERMMRAAITNLKFMPNGTVVPPLTEGMIRIKVDPASKQ